VSVAAYIPAPYGTPAAAAGLDVLEQLFYSYCQDHPHQAVTVSTLFAIHHAAEGFSALPPGGCRFAQLQLFCRTSRGHLLLLFC
jgi:hypothetical protein